MTYKDNQPVFNVNRKVANFKDFAQDKEKLAKADLQRKPNSEDQQHIGNKRTEYNTVTHKLTDYSDDEIKDRLDSMDNLEESLSSEYKDLVKKIKKLKCMGTIAEGVGYEYAKKDIIELIRKDFK
jgi:hypothetical protein